MTTIINGDRTTKINFNGSKFLGDAHDSLEVLYELLGREPLDPLFEQYGCFASRIHDHETPMLRFWGNFFAVSHAFSIDTNDPAVIENMTALIQANQRSRAYRNARMAHR